MIPAPTSRFRWRAACAVFGLVLAALAWFYHATAREVFPPPFADSAPHLIPVINYKAGHGFGGVIWELTRTYDPTGQHRFLQYPPVFHLVMTALIRQPTVEALYGCLGWISVGTLCLCAVGMWQGVGGAAGARKPAGVLLASLGLCAVSTWLSLGPAAGRPEALTAPLILLGALAMPRLRPAWQPWTAGVFIGVVAATQTVNAILLGLVYSVYASLPEEQESRPVVRWLRQVLVAAPLGVLVFAGCLALSPHPIGATLQGIAAHLRQFDYGHYEVVTSYFSPSINGSFYGIFFVAVLAGFLCVERRRINALVVLNLVLLLVAVWHFAIEYAETSYNVCAFVPGLATLAVRAMASPASEQTFAETARRRRMVWTAAFVIFGLMSIGLLRQGITFATYKVYGVSYADAKKHFTELLPPTEPIPIYTMYSLWPLASRFDHLYLYQSRRLYKPAEKPEAARPMLVLHQWYGRWLTPPEVPGYQLVWNDCAASPPTLFGVRLSATTPGYAFALYKPVDP